MRITEIYCFDDFVAALLDAGFGFGSGKGDGIFSLMPWNWGEAPPYETPVEWFTGNPDTDPWEWRNRAVTERNDIACAKLFFNKSGYITKPWYPYFLSARRVNDEGIKSFEDAYMSGSISHEAKRVYECIETNGHIPAHDIKRLTSFGKQEQNRFERALVELQRNMYITVCGRQQKISRVGEAYGWHSAVFCMTEEFWGSELFDEAAEIDPHEAEQKITARIMELNPAAEDKRIKKFIRA